ncbi:MAG: energy transducer TonB [Bdellovibrionales bacterium]|nr:energy transducer TonB [Bdellovibrionales bacterium]
MSLKSPLPKSLVASLLLHLLLFLLSSPLWLPKAVKNIPENSIFKVKFFKPTKDPIDGRIVDLETPESLSAISPKTKNLSDKNRVVDKETQAKRTENAKQASKNRSSNVLPKKNGFNFSLSNEFLNQLSTNQENTEPNQSSVSPKNYLPDVEFGAETQVSTREFKYASFFIRMKRQIESQWNPRSIASTQRLGRRNYITSLNIILDKNGNLEFAEVASSSGNFSLDQEALRSVKASAPFLNPPKGMIDSDQRVYISDLRFILMMGGLF